jgi:cytochrome c553
MKKIIYSFSVVILLLLIVSCSSDSDDDTVPINDPPDLNVSYSNAVKAIIDGNCLNCHGNPTQNSAPQSLTTYDEVKESVVSRGLIGRIESGNMPQNASKLSDVNIKKIKDWQAGGFKQ